MENNIAIIGGGNLGLAIANGLVRAGLYEAGNVRLTRRHPERATGLAQGLICTSDNLKAASESEIIICCVQPKQFNGVAEEISSVLVPGKHVIVSVITGLSLGVMKEAFGKGIDVIRAMPNTAIAIGESMTCIAADGSSKEHLQQVSDIFSTIGETLIIEERLMKAATVLGASGIAFFMRYIRAATQGGIQMGFDAEEAQKIAVQTALGAAKLIHINQNHPELEIDKVTTPEGCTIAGLNEMEHQGLSSALIKGIMTSYEKITAISS